ncbi:AT-hook motif nuclear-localized protein 11 [Eutrema salsugineum]|uniref:AT-hook motif nuclear-localized protein 11 n=1 Tax=Eutrema salsugineum TaxID=72664 RepID=UPI000CED45F0|nr:AT-hook motif nuclear-localized protein 11 [Eutrema salsugineum]
MDQNESTTTVSMSDSSPNSHAAPVTVTAEGSLVKMEKETKTGDTSMKRKRGRPRKYDPNANSIKPFGTPGESSTKRLLRKRRDGRSVSHGGWDFRAHMLTINTQEDIIERIMSFTQNGSRGICVLSANGAVSNVKIQPVGFNHNVLTFKNLVSHRFG